jgi:hypothetical protein
MAQSHASTIIPALLALIVLCAIGYVLFSDFEPSRQEHTLHPPIDIEEPVIEEVTMPTEAPSPDQQRLLDDEAKSFVAQLAPEDSGLNTLTLSGEQGSFVRFDSEIIIPDLEQRKTTIQALLNDDSLSDDTPVMIQYTEIQTTPTTLSALDANVEDKTVPVTIQLSNGQQLNAPLADLLNRSDLNADENITLINQIQHQTQSTIGDLSQLGLATDLPIDATINHGSQTLSMKDLIKDNSALPDDALFYIHRVSEQDVQGLWGIIQTGLIQRFRQGLSLEGIAQNKELVRVTIPEDADEPLPTGLSSFLGKILHGKVETSYVYNFHTHKMGHNPNLIQPGQQLIMIHFSHDELKRIYLFFAEQRDHNAQSFAVH